MGKQWRQWLTLFCRAPKSLQMVTAAMKLKTLAPWKKSYEQPRQHIKKQRHYLANKGPSSPSYGFFQESCMDVRVRTIKKAEHWRTDAFELCCWRTLESPLDSKEIKPVNPKGNQPWIFIGRMDAEAETPILWPPNVKNWLTGIDPDWERLKAGGEEDDRGWDGWLASLTQWTWVWANSRSWWWTGRPGMLQYMGLQRVRHDWVIELNSLFIRTVIFEYSRQILKKLLQYFWHYFRCSESYKRV